MQIRAEAKTNNRTINKQLIKNKRKSSYPTNHQVKWSKKTPFAKTVKKIKSSLARSHGNGKCCIFRTKKTGYQGEKGRAHSSICILISPKIKLNWNLNNTEKRVSFRQIVFSCFVNA